MARWLKRTAAWAWRNLRMSATNRRRRQRLLRLYSAA